MNFRPWTYPILGPLLEPIRSLAAMALRIWLIVGILLRVTRLRDRWDPLTLVYYTTPWPMIAAGLAILALHHARLGHQHRRTRYIVLSAGALFTWFALSWHSGAPSADPVALRVVHWNVARPNKLLPEVTAWLQRQDADFIAVAEALPKDGSTLQRWAAAFPDYQVHLSQGNLLCLVRGGLLETTGGWLGPSSHFARHRAHIRGQDLTILQVDVLPDAHRSRREPLQKLVELVRAEPPGHLLVMGDFNIPRDSVHLDPLRGELTNCFEAAGRGLIETWPMPFPVLSLDQIWSSPSLPLVRSYAGEPPLSDHRPMVAEFAAPRAKSPRR